MDKGGGGEVLRWFRRAIRTSKIGSLDFFSNGSGFNYILSLFQIHSFYFFIFNPKKLLVGS